MNNDFDNTNSGALFPNDRKRSDKSPDFKGEVHPVCCGCGQIQKMWVSAWKKRSRNGQGFLSMALTPDESSDSGQAPKPEPGKDEFDFDDDIPF